MEAAGHLTAERATGDALGSLMQSQVQHSSLSAPPAASSDPLVGSTKAEQQADGIEDVCRVRGPLRRVVYASTSGTVAVSADSSFVATDESPYAEDVTRGWPYYSTKVEAEKRARQWAQDEGLELICMRPTLLLGPGLQAVHRLAGGRRRGGRL